MAFDQQKLAELTASIVWHRHPLNTSLLSGDFVFVSQSVFPPPLARTLSHQPTNYQRSRFKSHVLVHNGFLVGLLVAERSSRTRKYLLGGSTWTISARFFVCFVGCLTSQQHASVSQGRICSDNFTCCHTETEVADPTLHLTQSQHTDTGPTSPSTDPITPGAWQGRHWSANFEVTGMTRPRKNSSQAGFEPGIFRSRGGRLNH